MAIPAFDQLNQAIEELDEYNDECGLPDELQPSAMVFMVDPRSNPNSQARIIGDPDVLVQVLMMALGDPANEAFRTAFEEAFGLEEPEGTGIDDFVRASGDAICGNCGQPYKRHAFDYSELCDGVPYLNVICDGTKVKL